MKTKQCILIAIVFALSAPAVILAQSSKIVHQNRQVSNFSSISASGGWDVVITQGNTYSLSIETNEDLIDKAVTEVRNGVLHIYNERSVRNAFNFGTPRIVRKAYVTVPQLKKIEASGGSDILFQTPFKAEEFEVRLSGGSDLKDLTLGCRSFTANFTGGSDASVRFSSVGVLKVDASGGSDVELYDISAGECNVNTSGGSDIELHGKTDNLVINASGGSDVSAFELRATRCRASLSGGSDGEFYVTDTFTVTASGASDVSYKGNPPTVNKEKDRSSTIKQVN
jgi:Protein of unknown function (DUF2807).